MEAQADEYGIRIEFVEAIAGATLTAEEQACYDYELHRRIYNYRLTPNEIACVHSHRKALRTFLESDSTYAVILEDDAQFTPYFKAGIRELTTELGGWEVARLNIGRPGMRPLNALGKGAEGITPVFATKIGMNSIGFAYTRHAAQIIYDELQRFSFPADTTIYHIILKHQLPTIAMQPQLIIPGLGDAPSTIDTPDTQHKRSKYGRKSPMQYIRHRLHLLLCNIRKQKLYRKVRRCVRRIPHT